SSAGTELTTWTFRTASAVGLSVRTAGPAGTTRLLFEVPCTSSSAATIRCSRLFFIERSKDCCARLASERGTSGILGRTVTIAPAPRCSADSSTGQAEGFATVAGAATHGGALKAISDRTRDESERGWRIHLPPD